MTAAPGRCVVCGASARVASAGFTQRYAQADAAPLRVPWWECAGCGSWFGAPHPTPEQIARNWAATPYNDPTREQVLARFKLDGQRFLLDKLDARIPARGRLLDYGCNFGRFLELSRERGWDAVGVDAFGMALDACRAKGFEVHQGWELEALDLAPESLDAITSNDVFYYVWCPWAHLRRANELLRPGGVLVMRTTNKRLVARVLRAAVPPGERRDRWMTRLLKSQFHAPTVHAIAGVMEEVGFRVEEVLPGARTAPPSEYSLPSRAFYAAADVLHAATRGRVNVSPGVWIVAVKPRARTSAPRSARASAAR